MEPPTDKYAMNINLVNITSKLMKEPRMGPRPIRKVLIYPNNPRGDNGVLKWRDVTSNRERLLGTQ